MKVEHLDHLNLSVRDFEESVAWYGRVFGFELVEEDVQEGVRWGVIRSGEAMLCIYEHPERKPQNRWTLADEGRHGVAPFVLSARSSRSFELPRTRPTLPRVGRCR